MAFSVDEQRISDDGPIVKHALADLAIWCELADEAKPLFKALLVRLRTARDDVQRFYDSPNDSVDRDRCLKGLKDELVTFSMELQRYFGVRKLTTPVELGARWSEETFAARVLHHKKLHRKLYEIHGGVSSSDNGLDRLFRLLQSHEHVTEWIVPFRAAVEVFEKAVADSVEYSTMLDMYKKNALLALEAVTLLRNAERNNDADEWGHNEPAKRLHSKLRCVKDGDTIMLPSWFIPESNVSYRRKMIGEGSFGTVHLGTWVDNHVAVKCLVTKNDPELDAARRKAFIDEADLWFNLSNPHLLKLYGACHVTSPPFFVCEESKEGNLSYVLWNDKSRMWRLLHQSALAIRFLHDKNIVHGDLKLNNILVGADGSARVADFGMSRFKKPSRNLMLTDLDPLMGGSGALRWCAPEALEGKAQIQSDVYSFAMCLVEAIGGEFPYYNVLNDDEVRDKIRRGELPERPEEMDDEIWELVKRMTVPDRFQRATINQVIPELQKRVSAELKSEIDRTVCPDCHIKLESGSSVCQACKPLANALVAIDLKATEELQQASREGDAVKVRALLENGNPDVNNLDVYQGGRTPLYQAALKGHVQVVKLLLEANANPNAAAKNGETPLHAACVKHKSETARALLIGGANVHSKDKKRRRPIHACIKSLEYDSLTNETLKTLQLLVSYGATWDDMCERWAWEESPALRLCILVWAQEHADGLEFSDIPIEVIERGVDSTHAYITDLMSSRETMRRRICLVGSSFAGKTTFAKSITSELLQPQLEHLDDRTIGIDHFPLRFEQTVASQKETKIHEVTFWDFVGQEAYQVAHSLFFSPRTMFLVCVDLEAFTMAFLQASIMAHVKKQEKQLMDEFIERKVMHWIRLILARQLDAEFVFIATKEDLLNENEVTGKLLKASLLAKLKEVETTVGETRKDPKTEEGNTHRQSAFSLTIKMNPPNVLFTSFTSVSSVRAARDQVQDLIIKSEYSFQMRDSYSQALEAIVKIRESAKEQDITTRIEHVFAPVDSLPAALQIKPKLCRVILQTLHDLGDVLWYEDLGVDLFHDTVILDPLLLIDFIREVMNHQYTGQIISHAELKSLPFWVGLNGNKQMKAMKQVLQAFHLVYSADADRIMEWDSDLIVPASWQTKTPAAWLFLGDILRISTSQSKEGDILRISTSQSKEGEAVRVDWEYHFEDGLPSSLFNHLVVASVSPYVMFDAGPDWILYEEKGVAACRIMVGRDVKSLHRTIHIEAVVAETAAETQIDELWGAFEQLCDAFVMAMRGYPGLAVSSFAWDDAENKIDLERLVKSPAPEESAKWMPPAATWEWFRQLVTNTHRSGDNE